MLFQREDRQTAGSLRGTLEVEETKMGPSDATAQPDADDLVAAKFIN